MLELSTIHINTDRVLKGLAKKRFHNATTVINTVISLDTDRKKNQLELDTFSNEMNQLSKSIGSLMKQGRKDDAEQAKEKTVELKQQIKLLSEKQNKIQDEITALLLTIPNIPHEAVPDGISSQDNKVTFEWGHLPGLDNNAKPHWELIKDYDIIDFDLGNKITGAGFPVYKNKGAKLQRALINFFLDEADKAGYQEIQPPVVINADSGRATGQLPDKEGQMYQLIDEDFYLIPTAEVPITNLYRNTIVKDESLPLKNVGYTPCFRREAGSWGADVRGLNRLHQFDKVEIVRVEKPENSYQVLDEMCNHVKGLLIKLELPFRIVQLCGGDLGFTSAMTYDFEVYSGAQKKWLEVSSVSNFETYQSNRLKLRYKNDEGKNILLHTLNGSALALPRVVAALLENNQTEKGITIPRALQEYTGFAMIDR